MLMNKTAIECWNILKYEIESIIGTFVTLKKKQGKRSRKKHLSKEAIRKIVFKQTMWRVYRCTRNDEDYANYKEYSVWYKEEYSVWYKEEYSVWYKDATRLVTLLGTSISAPGTPRSSRQMQIANAPSTSPREHYLRNLAIPFCDAEFHDRFNPESRKGIEILALLPGIIKETGNVQHVVDGLMFWESDMPNVSSLRAEVKEWQRYWRTTKPTQSSSSHNLAECLEHSDEDIFPNIRTLLGIGCTLHVGSCEAFIPLPATGQNLPTQHDGENRLSGLTLMNMNHGMEIDLETVCQMFIERNKRKMFSSYILYQ